MKKQTIRFSKKDSKRFFITLNKRVNDHFKKLNTSKTGNWELYLKTLIMFHLIQKEIDIKLLQSMQKLRSKILMKCF